MKRIALLVVLLVVPVPGHAQQSRKELKFDIDALDKSVDPCTDFYQFACGGWLARNPVPSDRSSWAVYEQMRQQNQERVQRILADAAVLQKGRAGTEQQIGDYYASCMDEGTIEAKGLDPLQPELKRIDAIQDREALAEEIGRLHRLGADPLFGLTADQQLEDATRVVAYLDQSGLNLPEPSYYTSEDAKTAKIRAQYRAHLEDAFKLLGQGEGEAAASAGDVLGIEGTLARASLTPLERRDRRAWYHEMTVTELQHLAPAFPWNRYFAAVGFRPQGELNVAVPKYMQAIDGLLGRTPFPAWRNYLRWELARLATPALPARVRRADFDFYEAALQGVGEQPPRPHQCEALTNRDLGEAVGEIYAKLYFPPSSKQRVLDLVAHVRRAMQEDFQEIPWMSQSTKREALRKLETLRAMIGYPDRWRDYSRLRITRGDALGNAFRAQEFEVSRQIAKIGQPVDRGEFYELPQGVEGYHDNPLNVIAFTAGILQPPFFDPRMDDAIMFGLAGAVIGHELSHAFDDKGHLFDGAGNMRDWWTPQDAQAYDERAACFARQYSGYPVVDDIHVNGELTLGENIADNGGLQLAHRAFEKEQAEAGPRIDGYSPDQRFFLGWAQWRCANVTPQSAAIRARTDPHSPGRWRVNGVVSNTSGFARAYQCKAGDPMVRPEPCRIW